MLTRIIIAIRKAVLINQYFYDDIKIKGVSLEFSCQVQSTHLILIKISKNGFIFFVCLLLQFRSYCLIGSLAGLESPELVRHE